MSLQFYFHPLASFCHKILIALHEKGIDFAPVIVDLGDPESAAAFRTISPMGKMPALVDEELGRTILETTIIIDYLDQHFSGPRMVPIDGDLALDARFWDRFHDNYVELPMQKIVTDRLRPEGAGDAFGVEQARSNLRDAYAAIEAAMAGRLWAVGDVFGLADCAAAPALFYANTVEPIGEAFPATVAYLQRLMQRPSYRRVLIDAEPYFVYFPMPTKPDISGIRQQ